MASRLNQIFTWLCQKKDYLVSNKIQVTFDTSTNKIQVRHMEKTIQQNFNNPYQLR
jgi:hypothetical protein